MAASSRTQEKALSETPALTGASFNPNLLVPKIDGYTMQDFLQKILHLPQKLSGTRADLQFSLVPKFTASGIDTRQAPKIAPPHLQDFLQKILHSQRVRWRPPTLLLTDKAAPAEAQSAYAA